MKKVIKNVIIILMVVFLLMGFLSPIFADTNADFEANPEKYNQLCKGVITENNREICKQYKQYLLDKTANNQNEIDRIEADLVEIRKNITANLDKIADFEEQIRTIETTIADLNYQIEVKEIEIRRLEGLIAEREIKIAEIEEKVKEYMVSSQSTMRVNGYIEFIMGANDFADIVRRVEGMNNIKRHNEGLIEDLRVERKALEDDKGSVETQRDAIDGDKQQQLLNQERVERLKTATVEAYNQFMIQKVNLETDSASIQEQIQYDEQLAQSITASGTLIIPVPSFYRVSESVWHYDSSFGGGVHLGTDLAAGYFAPIVSMGNGVVVVAQGGCDTYSSMGCNGGLGNHMTMIVASTSGVYGTLIMHMAAGSFTVGPGQYVDAGVQVGGVGNSGSSYGPHAHVEIFDLGVNTVQEGLEMWNSTWRTAQFGLGGSPEGTSSICENRGTPCRLNPETVLGLNH